jgi:hypothetical protein
MTNDKIQMSIQAQNPKPKNILAEKKQAKTLFFHKFFFHTLINAV